MVVSAHIIHEDQISNQVKHVPFGFRTEDVKVWEPSEFQDCTLVTFYDETQVDICLPFSYFNHFLMKPEYRSYEKHGIGS